MEKVKLTTQHSSCKFLPSDFWYVDIFNSLQIFILCFVYCIVIIKIEFLDRYF